MTCFLELGGAPTLGTGRDFAAEGTSEVDPSVSSLQDTYLVQQFPETTN